MVTIHFDGSCSPVNPGGHAHAGCIVNHNNKEKLFSFCIGDGEKMSCNVAEYSGLTKALDYLIENNLQSEEVKIFGDSMLVIMQCQGKWKIKKGLYKFYALHCRELLKKFNNIAFNWIPREDNYRADLISDCSKSEEYEKETLNSEYQRIFKVI